MHAWIFDTLAVGCWIDAAGDLEKRTPIEPIVDRGKSFRKRENHAQGCFEYTMALSSSSFDAFNGKIQSSALDSVRKSVGIPADVSFHRSVDPALATQLDTLSTRVLSLTNRVLALSQLSAGSASNSSGRKGKDKEAQRLHGQDDVVDRFQSLVVDVVDGLFERTVRSFDLWQ